jgi:hypothetical protein
MRSASAECNAPHDRAGAPRVIQGLENRRRRFSKLWKNFPQSADFFRQSGFGGLRGAGSPAHARAAVAAIPLRRERREKWTEVGHEPWMNTQMKYGFRKGFHPPR